MGVLRWLLRKNRGWVALALLMAILSNGSQIAYLYFVGELVNQIEVRSKIELSFFLLMGVFLISNAATQFLYQLTGRYCTERAAHTLRMGYLRAKLQSTVREAEEDSVAHAMSVVQNELSNANQYLSNTLFEMAGMSVSGILVFGFLLFVNAKLTMVILLPTVLTLVYVVLSGRKLSKIVTATLEEKNHLNRIAYSSVDTFPMIAVFDAKSFLMDRFEKALEKWGSAEVKKDRMYAIFNSLSGVLSRLPLLLLLLTGCYMVLTGEILLGTLIMFLNLQKSVTQFVMNLPSWIAGFKTFTVNLSRIDVA
ncbi:MAG: ABC transporter ATP-binding protein [Lachnospiraceae bacterium]|nr:ABC transporter ATP-binding protein [Lachnospiraceae bacterium]